MSREYRLGRHLNVPIVGSKVSKPQASVHQDQKLCNVSRYYGLYICAYLSYSAVTLFLPAMGSRVMLERNSKGKEEERERREPLHSRTYLSNLPVRFRSEDNVSSPLGGEHLEFALTIDRPRHLTRGRKNASIATRRKVGTARFHRRFHLISH